MTKIRYISIIMLFIAPVLAGSSSYNIRFAGTVLVTVNVVILIMLGILNLTQSKVIRYNKTILFITILSISFFLLWSMLRADDYSAIMWTINASAVLGLFFTQMVNPISADFMKNLFRWGSIAIVFFVILISSYMKINYFANPNYFGGILILYTFFPIGSVINGDKQFGWYGLLAIVVGVIFSASRAGMLSILSLGFIYIFITMRRRKIGVPVMVLVSVISITLLRYIYANLDNPIWHALSLKYFHKPVETGRLWIWQLIVDQLQQKPFLGWGTGASVIPILGKEFSSHNGLIQLTYQLGIIGSLLFLAMYLSIAYGLIRKDDCISKAAMYTMGAAFVLEMFEVFIIQNNTPFSSSLWLILGLGMAKHNS